jgi:SAM-dependent methyltransferase
MRNIEKIRMASADEIFNNISPEEKNIRKSEMGCFDLSLWSGLIGSKEQKELEICEFGSWYGYGVNRLANFLKSKDIKFKIACVDTWLGSPEHIFDIEGVSVNSLKELKLKNGFPTFYYDFLEVTKYFENTENIIPFPNTTMCFMNMCRKLNCKFDYIIIDASHQYEDVKIDLEIARVLLKDGGRIIGDDLGWPGVSKALEEFVNTYKVGVYKTSNQYII